EMEGDQESAQFFYAKAQQADHSSQLVTVSNRAEAEGHKVASVADTSQTHVENKMEAAIQQRRAQGGTPALKRRGAALTAPQPSQPQDQRQQQPSPNQDQQPQQDQNQQQQNPPQQPQ